MDYYEDEPVSLYLKDLTLIVEHKSPRQVIKLFKHPLLGKILVINGEIQHVEKYQALYHEPLVHLPAAFLPNIRSALIIGGGSLFAASEILKYPSLESVTLCDYDHIVLDLMKEHYSHARDVVRDGRFHYIEEDARNYINREHKKFDLIINDCFNLVSESKAYNTSFYRLLTNMCTDFGVCADIIYRHIFDKSVTINTLSYLGAEKKLALSLVVVPEYPGILHIETIWGNSPYITQRLSEPVNPFQRDIVAGHIKSPFIYYSPAHIPFYLYLPPYIKCMFNL